MQPGTPFIGLANYTELLSDTDVGRAWVQYIRLRGRSRWCVETVGGVPPRLLINQVRCGRQWLLAAVMLPWALPPVVNAVIWLWIYNPSYGLLNGILHGLGLPFDNHVWFNDRATRARADRRGARLAHDAAHGRHRAGRDAGRFRTSSTRPRASTAPGRGDVPFRSPCR